jgi:hypothetical protein
MIDGCGEKAPRQVTADDHAVGIPPAMLPGGKKIEDAHHGSAVA